MDDVGLTVQMAQDQFPNKVLCSVHYGLCVSKYMYR